MLTTTNVECAQEDNSGTITVEEFIEALDRFGCKLTVDEVSELCHELDEDGDGEISREEFRGLSLRVVGFLEAVVTIWFCRAPGEKSAIVLGGLLGAKIESNLMLDQVARKTE